MVGASGLVGSMLSYVIFHDAFVYQYKTKLQLCAVSFLIKEVFRDYGQVHINSIGRSLGLLYGASFPIAAKAVGYNKIKSEESAAITIKQY